MIKFLRYNSPYVLIDKDNKRSPLDKHYVRVKQCTSDREQCWYKNKIGKVFLVTDNFFYPDYILIDTQESRRGLYPMIDKKDAEVITPTLLEKVVLYFAMANIERHRNKRR